MNRRLLQGAWEWQRLSGLVQRISFQTSTSAYGYAIGAMRLPDTSAIQAALCASKSPLPSASAWHSSIGVPARDFATAPKMAPPTTEPPNTRGVPSLIEKLDAYYRQSGQLSYELLERLIKALEAQPNVYNQLLTAEQVKFLLRACGTEMPAQPANVRLALFERLWLYLSRHTQLSAEDYLTRLHVLQHNRAPLADFPAFLEQLQQCDAKQTFDAQHVYTELLNTAAAVGNIQQATAVLAEMRAQEIALTERHFNALLLGHARSHDLPGCKTVLDSMLAAGVTPSVETQSVLVSAYMENNAPALAAELLNKFHRQFAASHIVLMLRSLLYVDAPDAELTAQLVHELPKDFALSAEVQQPLRQLCIELLHNGKLALVTSIVAMLPTPHFNENQDIDTFGIFLLQELFRAKCDATEIIATAQMLRESGKNTRALHIATEIALRRNPETALTYLEALAVHEPLRPHYFWPLLLHSYKSGEGEAGVMRALHQMKALNVACDRETFTHYALPRLSIMLERPEQALKVLDAAGLKPSLVLVDVLTYLLVTQRLEDAQMLLELYPTKVQIDELLPVLSNAAVNARATRRYQQYAKLLVALSKKCDNSKADWVGELLLRMLNTQTRLRSDLKAFQRFVNEMSKCELLISSSAVEAISTILQQHNSADVDLTAIKEALRRMTDRSVVLQQAAQDNTTSGGNATVSSFIKHPRDMTLDELECHLVELEAKKLNTRGVLRRLLQLCVRDGRLQRALEIKAKCDALKVQISAGMLASIFDMYIKLQDLPNAATSLQHLQKEFPGFTIDEHKLIDYAALLVHEKQLDNAKELLEQRAATKKVTGGNYVLKNVWNFLTNVAKHAALTPTLPKERNLTRENFHFLLKLRYANAHNAVLGPIVRERLLRGDIVNAVAEFQQLAGQYKTTPLQFELLSLLVRLSNGADAVESAQYGNVSVEEAQRLLNAVTETIAKVYGALNMNSALLLAFAESGTENQLRRLLINPEFRINNELLLKNCEYLGEEGAVTTLLRLARGARGLSRVIDEHGIYNTLLGHFAKANNCVAALKLYETLEADDELKISQEFLRNLVHLLRVNNVEIPSNLALRAQIISDNN